MSKLIAASLLVALLTAAGIPHARGGSDTGFASGSAVDDDGTPLAGVHVEVVYQTYRAHQLGRHGASVKKTTLTAGDGRFRIDMAGLPPGEYLAHAYRTIRNGGRDIQVALLPDDAAAFTPDQNAIRHFRVELVEYSDRYPYGNAGVFVLRNAVMDYTDLGGAKVTLANVATGRTFVRAVRSSGEGLIVTGIPFGTYRCSVSLNGQPLRLSLPDDGEYSEAVIHGFTTGPLGDQFRVDAKP